MSLCERCPFRAYAERKPESWLARLWRWHTTWCPGWKAYQRRLSERDAQTRDASNADDNRTTPSS